MKRFRVLPMRISKSSIKKEPDSSQALNIDVTFLEMIHPEAESTDCEKTP